jgi:O-methyltransferase domain
VVALEPPASRPEMPAPVRVLGMTLDAQVQLHVLRAALQLEVPDHLASTPKSADELAGELHCNRASLYRLLRAMTVPGLVRELPAGTFVLEPLGELLRRDRPDSFRDFVLFVTDPYRFAVFERLAEGIRTGRCPFELTFGMQDFDYFGLHPELATLFQRAMTSASAQVARAIVDAYPFGEAHLVADIGGGQGLLLGAILGAHPGVRGLLYDLPYVLDGARHALGASGLLDRCSVVAGSFFDSVPAGADIFLLKSIVHDWPDEKARTILRNVRQAMATGSRLLIVDLVLPDDPAPTSLYFSDINMLAFPGGRERKKAEVSALLAESGLRLNRVIPLPVRPSIVEAVPA